MLVDHSFAPNALTDVLIIPVLKNKLKDPSNSANYRPIAIASSASKIFELLILNRMGDFLNTSDNQFGFKKMHSTDLCIFALKEVVNYYRSMNTPIFICFIDIKSAFDRVSYWKLFVKLLKRGVPAYLVLILCRWYCSQRLYAGWGSVRSTAFTMSNGIRQGSLLSPYLFNVYVDELNLTLNRSGVGCHVAGQIMNNFSYADDMALVCPSATALNELLARCDAFAQEHYIIFSTSKTVCMSILPKTIIMNKMPNIYLSDCKLSFVNSFKYLGHMISSDFSDEEDLRRENRSLCARGNAIVRKFHFCNMTVKTSLFKTFCYSLYCSSLWSTYRVSVLYRLKVTYNTIMRRLAGVPPWHSAAQMFVELGVRSFGEVLRSVSYSLMERADVSQNGLLSVLRNSDASTVSLQRQRWTALLFTRPHPGIH